MGVSPHQFRSEIKNRFSADDDPVFDPQKKGHHQIKSEGDAEGDKREVDKQQSQPGCADSQFVGYPGDHIEAVEFKKVSEFIEHLLEFVLRWRNLNIFSHYKNAF